jgi:hypothetical protein
MSRFISVVAVVLVAGCASEPDRTEGELYQPDHTEFLAQWPCPDEGEPAFVSCDGFSDLALERRGEGNYRCEAGDPQFPALDGSTRTWEGSTGCCIPFGGAADVGAVWYWFKCQ